jgi:F-type H+-transporting ATPase subunit delta
VSQFDDGLYPDRIEKGMALIKRSIARRYARALLELTKEDRASAAKTLSDFRQLLEQNHTLSEVLISPAFSLAQRERVLGEVVKKQAIGAPLDRFLSVLVKRRRVAYLPAIEESFQELVDEMDARMRVSVETAAPLDAPTLENLQSILSNATHRTVILDQRINPRLIGGISVRVGSLLVDGSLRTQIARLRESLFARKT